MRKKFHSGVFLKEFLEDLEMTQEELAKKTCIKYEELSFIISGKTSITTNIAESLSNALGTSVEFWLNIQKSYNAYKKEGVK